MQKSADSFARCSTTDAFRLYVHVSRLTRRDISTFIQIRIQPGASDGTGHRGLVSRAEFTFTLVALSREIAAIDTDDQATHVSQLVRHHGGN